MTNEEREQVVELLRVTAELYLRDEIGMYRAMEMLYGPKQAEKGAAARVNRFWDLAIDARWAVVDDMDKRIPARFRRIVARSRATRRGGLVAMRISKRTREQAALICAIAASTEEYTGTSETSVGAMLGSDERAIDLAIDATWHVRCRSGMASPSSWAATFAEAALMLEEGWTP